MFSKGAGFSVSVHLQVISIHLTVNAKTEIHKYVFTYIANIQSTKIRKHIAHYHNVLIPLPVLFTVIMAIIC